MRGAGVNHHPGKKRSHNMNTTKIKELLILHHSHTDIGYTFYQDRVFRAHRGFVLQAMDLAEKYRHAPEGERFKWVCEVLTTTEDFLRQATPAQVERFVALHQEGLIEVGGLYVNGTALLDERMLTEQALRAERLRTEFGLEIRYGLNCDINGQQWGLVEAMLDGGLNGLAMAINHDLARTQTPCPRAFLWEAPSGRRLPLWHGRHYGLGGNWVYAGYRETGRPDMEAARKQVAVYLDELAKDDYPYDFAYAQVTSLFLGDNGPPHEELALFAREWNARGWQPRVRIATLKDLFAAIARQPPETVEVRRGDWPDWWSLGVSSCAYETALARRNHALLRTTETMQAVGALLPAGPAIDRVMADQARRSMFLYDEHTFTGFDATEWPDSLNARSQTARKNTYCYEAFFALSDLAKAAATDLAARVPEVSEPSLVVFNPLPWPRKVPLHLPISGEKGPYTGHHVSGVMEVCSAAGPFLPTVDYGIVDLPACGYRVLPQRLGVPAVSPMRYTGRERRGIAVTPRGGKAGGGVTVGGERIENRYYRAMLPAQSGGIASLVDKASGREWVDTASPWALGQYVYETLDADGGRALLRSQLLNERRDTDDRRPDLRPRRRGPHTVLGREVFPGEGQTTVTLQLAADGAGELFSHFTFYDDLPWIDIVHDIEKLPVREAESVYAAFPVAVPHPVPRYDCAGAAVIAGVEQFPDSCRDYYCVQSWADVSNADSGVTVLAPDAPHMMFGDFTHGKYAGQLEAGNGFMAGWILNNFWFTNFPADQRGRLRIRYRVLPHNGPFDPVATARLAAEMLVPPFVHGIVDKPVGLLERPEGWPRPGTLAAEASFLSIAPDNVMMVECKNAEDGRGMIIRLREIAGCEARAQVRLAFPLARAWVCDRAEKPLRELAVHGGQLSPVNLKAHESLGIRLEGVSAHG
jgi:alpha-mannosidase